MLIVATTSVAKSTKNHRFQIYFKFHVHYHYRVCTLSSERPQYKKAFQSFFHFYLLSAAYNVQPYTHRWKEFQSFFPPFILLTHETLNPFFTTSENAKKIFIYIKLLWVSFTLHWCFYCSLALYPHLTFIRSMFFFRLMGFYEMIKEVIQETSKVTSILKTRCANSIYSQIYESWAPWRFKGQTSAWSPKRLKIK